LHNRTTTTLTNASSKGTRIEAVNQRITLLISCQNTQPLHLGIWMLAEPNGIGKRTCATGTQQNRYPAGI
jgi:hypothetical protein